MHLAGQILRVHVSFICFYFYLNAMLPLSDCHDILTEILLKLLTHKPTKQPKSLCLTLSLIRSPKIQCPGRVKHLSPSPPPHNGICPKVTGSQVIFETCPQSIETLKFIWIKYILLWWLYNFWCKVCSLSWILCQTSLTLFLSLIRIQIPPSVSTIKHSGRTESFVGLHTDKCLTKLSDKCR